MLLLPLDAKQLVLHSGNVKPLSTFAFERDAAKARRPSAFTLEGQAPWNVLHAFLPHSTQNWHISSRRIPCTEYTRLKSFF